MKTKEDYFNAGAQAFFSGVLRGKSGFEGWQLRHWRRGWDAAHDGQIQPPQKTH